MDGKLFLNILASALNSVPFDASPYSDQQWQKAFELSQIHKLLPLFTDASTPCCPLEKERLSPYIRQSKLMITQQVMNSADFLELCKALQKENIPFVTVKGIICRSTYKKPDLRVSGDEDLLVFGENFEKAGEVLKNAGFISVNPQKKDIEETFSNGRGLFIELHKSLFEDDGYFRSYNNLLCSASDNIYFTDIGNQKVPTLSPQLHLLYLILHSAKHFFHGGVGIRQVADMLNFYKHFRNEINLHQVFEKCREVSLRSFAEACFDIGRKHLGFDEIPFATANGDDLLADILDAGIYGSSTLSRQHSSGLTLSAVKGKKTGALSRFFPSSKELGSRFDYAKKYPVLLPVAWGHRLIKYSAELSDTSDNSPKDTLNLGKKRIELMKHYGMIPESEVK